ncbi:caspase, EACC1-associated type [Nonomuraea gerenzanensis]|uniref:High-affnity carbon uptake protein Hat/HatR n=1 Tax=Nonomuraea gerenzanensis TaxID=93944 RepID=A0A1M4EJ29_9ACTN|nr:caspase family protein [Nonomuraea gerenzanensis]UBU10514.1 caspase family protein [Nonomuraea gerenzanensis]SBO98919.1 High-affnity carbon uptake protein Hat/HatR [Nonomuraea gerenzanensis]
MDSLLLEGPGVRVLLAGSGSHAPGSRLPEVPSIAGTLTDLGRCLTECAGLDPAHLTVLQDPADPRELGAALVAAAEEASEVLVVHYAGHGLLSVKGELHLATRATVDLGKGIAGHQALPYGEVRDILAGSRAALVLLVLDCCFSGRAGLASRAAVGEVFESVRHGTYVLAASGRDEAAWAPPQERHTAFTGALIELLTAGDPLAPRLLTLDDVHRSLARTLTERGLPEPRRQAADRGGHAPLAVNAAWRQRGRGRAGEFSPYRGLAAFGVEDSAYFFGRAGLTGTLADRVTEQLDRPGPLIVTGPSGVGKSSLLRAGLIPAMSGTRFVVLVPGSDPVSALASRFAPLSSTVPETDAAGLRAAIEADPTHLRQVLAGGPGRAVLIVDQFEEVFTACRDERERETFIRALAAACGEPAGTAPVVVVLGVRADFFGHCSAHPELLTALEHPLVVGPMAPVHLREVIEGPARLTGLQIEDGLVELLLEELGTAGGSVLPLLSHALLATWQHREGDRLTLVGYRATGGISRSLAKTADSTLEHLDLRGRQAARRLLPRLVRLGDGTEDTRRRVPIPQLLPAPGTERHEVARRVLDRFVAARLVSVDEEAVQITHEALIRAWPRLRAWIEADRAGLLVLQQLVEDAAEWLRHDRDPAFLYRDTRLVAAQSTTGAAGDSLPDEAREFLAASAQRDRQAVRRRRAMVGLLAGLLMVALVAAVGAVQQWRVAAEHRATTAGRDLVAQAREVAKTDPRTALRLSVAAMSVTDDPGTAGEATAVITANLYAGSFAPGREIRGRPAIIPGTAVVVVADMGGVVSLWDLSRGGSPVKIAEVSAGVGEPNALALSPDGTLLAVGGQGRTPALFDTRDPSRPRLLNVVEPPSSGFESVHSLAFAAGRLVTGGTRRAGEGAEQVVTVWDVADLSRPRHVHRLGDGDGWARVGASADGRFVVACEQGGWLGLLTMTRRSTLREVGTSGEVACDDVTFAISRTGTMVLSDFLAGVWDLSGRAAPRRVAELESPDPGIHEVAVQEDGRLAVTADARGNVILWNLSVPASPQQVVTLRRGVGLRYAAFEAGGDRLAIVTADEVELWDVGRVGRPRPLSGPAVQNLIGLRVAGNARVLYAVHGPDAGLRHDVFLWDIGGTGPPRRISVIEGVRTATVSPSGRLMAGELSESGQGALWDVTDPAFPRRITELPEMPDLISPDDRFMVVRTWEEGLSSIQDISDPSSPSSVSVIKVHPAGLVHGGRFLLGWSDALGESVSTELWDVADLRHPVRKLVIRDAAVHFLPDGGDAAVIAAGVENVLLDLKDPAHPIRSTRLDDASWGPTFSFSEDGRFLRDLGPAGLTIWEVSDRRHPRKVVAELGIMAEGGGALLSPDGLTGVTRSGGNGATIWDLTRLMDVVAHPRETACASIGTGLDRQEWADHLPDVAYRETC